MAIQELVPFNEEYFKSITACIKNSEDKRLTLWELSTSNKEAKVAKQAIDQLLISSQEKPPETEEVKGQLEDIALLKKVGDKIAHLFATHLTHPNLKGMYQSLLRDASTQLVRYQEAIETAHKEVNAFELSFFDESLDFRSIAHLEPLFISHRELIKFIEQHIKVTHLTEKIDLYSFRPDATPPLLITGFDLYDRPFIIIRACEYTRAIGREKIVKNLMTVYFTGQINPGPDPLPNWRVAGMAGREYFDGRPMSHDEFLGKLQQLFTQGLSWKYDVYTSQLFLAC